MKKNQKVSESTPLPFLISFLTTSELHHGQLGVIVSNLMIILCFVGFSTKVASTDSIFEPRNEAGSTHPGRVSTGVCSGNPPILIWRRKQ